MTIKAERRASGERVPLRVGERGGRCPALRCLRPLTTTRESSAPSVVNICGHLDHSSMTRGGTFCHWSEESHEASAPGRLTQTLPRGLKHAHGHGSSCTASSFTQRRTNSLLSHTRCSHRPLTTKLLAAFTTASCSPRRPLSSILSGVRSVRPERRSLPPSGRLEALTTNTVRR